MRVDIPNISVSSAVGMYDIYLQNLSLTRRAWWAVGGALLQHCRLGAMLCFLRMRAMNGRDIRARQSTALGFQEMLNCRKFVSLDVRKWWPLRVIELLASWVKNAVAITTKQLTVALSYDISRNNNKKPHQRDKTFTKAVAEALVVTGESTGRAHQTRIRPPGDSTGPRSQVLYDGAFRSAFQVGHGGVSLGPRCVRWLSCQYFGFWAIFGVG
mmetsp:Transcript_6848/g.12717  ORF Transcript_6848/g.12717 Transcript_6848/m.12717 type:complete len:213 (+) Transcript_6848:171-809(+)